MFIARARESKKLTTVTCQQRKGTNNTVTTTATLQSKSVLMGEKKALVPLFMVYKKPISRLPDSPLVFKSEMRALVELLKLSAFVLVLSRALLACLRHARTNSTMISVLFQLSSAREAKMAAGLTEKIMAKECGIVAEITVEGQATVLQHCSVAFSLDTGIPLC